MMLNVRTKPLLDFFEVKRVNIKKAPDGQLDFHVIVPADIIIGIGRWNKRFCCTRCRL